MSCISSLQCSAPLTRVIFFASNPRHHVSSKKKLETTICILEGGLRFGGGEGQTHRTLPTLGDSRAMTRVQEEGILVEWNSQGRLHRAGRI